MTCTLGGAPGDGFVGCVSLDGGDLQQILDPIGAGTRPTVFCKK